MIDWSHSRVALQSIVLGLGMACSAGCYAQEKVIFQVTDNDVARWTLTLNNVRNLQNGVGGADKADIEVIAYGPGIQLLRAGSPIAARITETVGNKVKVVACENTMAGNQLTHADMLPDIGYVPAGVVEVMRKQQAGYAYIRP